MRFRPPGLLAVTAVAGSMLAPTAGAAGQPAPPWFSAWSRPQSVIVGAAADPADGGRGPGPLVDQTVRAVVRLTGAGSAVRLRLSNRYGATLSPEGTVPLRVTAVTFGRRTQGASVAGLHAARFAGRPDVTIAPGATVVSDPLPVSVTSGQLVAVSLHVDLAAVTPQHGASFVTSYVSAPGSGDRTTDPAGTAFTARTSTTPVLTGVDVQSRALRGVVAATGGSVVDGHGSDLDQFTDWPSWLSRRLPDRTVVNNGLGGTTASTACAVPGAGPSVEERVAHDSLALPGLTHLIVYAGTNDVAGVCTAEQVIAAYRSIITQAHARKVRVLVSTITPRGSYTALQNAEREKVNSWVRRGGTCGGECDRALDFDVVLRDPADHDRIAPALDSGDGMHPTGEGYRRVAASIPLGALT